MNNSRLLICCAAAMLALTPAAGAQQTGTAPAALRGTNCGQFLDAVAIAAAPSQANGKELSEQDVEAAEDAQDELVITLFWIHGYQTGKTGKAAMLDQKWMADTVSRMVEICGANGNAELPISEAVKQL